MLEGPTDVADLLAPYRLEKGHELLFADVPIAIAERYVAARGGIVLRATRLPMANGRSSGVTASDVLDLSRTDERRCDAMTDHVAPVSRDLPVMQDRLRPDLTVSCFSVTTVTGDPGRCARLCSHGPDSSDITAVYARVAHAGY